MVWLRALAVWLLRIGVEVLHGTVRVLVLAPRLGDLRATHFNQSCGAACAAPVAPSTGEILAPAATRAGQVLEKVVQATEALHGILTVSKFLDEAQRTQVEGILARCASEANFKVNEEVFGKGKSCPNQSA